MAGEGDGGRGGVTNNFYGSIAQAQFPGRDGFQGRATQPGRSVVRHNLPPLPPHFQGREEELEEIRRALGMGDHIAVTSSLATCADGGVGKTVLALKFAHEHLGEFPGGVAWVNADAPSWAADLAAQAGRFGVEDRDTPEATAQAIAHQLQQARSLLILDNLDEPGRLKDDENRWLPTGSCLRLITTRSRHVQGAQLLALDNLSESEARALLVSFRADAAEPENAEAVGRILDGVERWAVAVTLVGAYMSAPGSEGVSWGGYAEHLAANGVLALQHVEELVGEDRADRYQEAIGALVADVLGRLSDAQARALEYAALLPPDHIPGLWLELLLRGDEDVEGKARPGEDAPERGVIDGLASRQLLVRTESEEPVWRLHRVIGDGVRRELAADDPTRERLLDEVAWVASERGRALFDRADAERSLRHEVPAIREMARLLEIVGRAGDAARVHNAVQNPLKALGHYEAARHHCERAVDIYEGIDLEDESRLASAYSNLATVLQELGDLTSACEYMERAIALNRAAYEPTHPTLAVRYSNLATMLKDLGELTEARRYLESAIAIQEAAFEPTHPTLAVSYSNLAMVLLDLGELTAARGCMERAIAIEEAAFEPTHPTLAVSYLNLAMVLKDLSELPAARGYLERAIAIQEAAYEPTHPKLAVSYSNLAMLLKDLGELTAARGCMERAIAIEEAAFEATHPRLARRYSGMAMVLNDLGEPIEAREFLERAVAIDEAAHGPTHPSLAASYSNLATTLIDFGEVREARSYLDRAIAIQKAVHGPNHPMLAANYSNLAMVLHDLGELTEARGYLERAIAVEESAYQPARPTLAVSYSNLAMVLKDLGELTAARGCMERAIAIEEAAFEPTHPTLAASYSNLAMVLKDLGERPQALKLLEKARAIVQACLPAGHPHVRIVEGNIAAVRRAMQGEG